MYMLGAASNLNFIYKVCALGLWCLSFLAALCTAGLLLRLGLDRVDGFLFGRQRRHVFVAQLDEFERCEIGGVQFDFLQFGGFWIERERERLKDNQVFSTWKMQLYIYI